MHTSKLAKMPRAASLPHCLTASPPHRLTLVWYGRRHVVHGMTCDRLLASSSLHTAHKRAAAAVVWVCVAGAGGAGAGSGTGGLSGTELWCGENLARYKKNYICEPMYFKIL